MNFKKLLISLATIGAMSVAHAQHIQRVTETFVSGAVFDGLVTFTSNYDNVVAVDGYLTGGGYGSQHISWIWGDLNLSTVPNQTTNFLMDGTDKTNYFYFITFTWDYSAAPKLVFSSLGEGNAVRYSDLATGGTITAVPEPETYAMMLAGLGMLGFAARRKRTAA